MKKYVSLLMLLFVMSIVSGCSNKGVIQPLNNIEDDSDYYGYDDYDEPPSGMGFDITNEDVFDTGFYNVQYDTFESAYVYFASSNESDANVEWRIYIVDNELEDDEIDELLTQEPVAINSGSADIRAGQWIYVYCSVNSKTAEAPTNSTFSLYSYRDYA